MNDADGLEHSQLAIALSASVPLCVAEFQQRPWRELDAQRSEWVQMIAEHGDHILYRSKREGDSAKAFSALVQAIAFLSFAPGGVKLLGTHWQNRHPELAYPSVK